MTKVLSLALRPSSFRGLYGQSKVVTTIQSQISSGRIPRAWMFTGQTGSGKITVARIIAVSLNCSHSGFGDPCRLCDSTKFQIHEINASDISGVDGMRELAVGAQYAPLAPTRKRVYILNEAQRLSTAAQNLLLKHFEEAPRTTVWMICTTEPEKILRTLRRRCMVYTMQALRPTDIEKFLAFAASKILLKRSLDLLVEQANQQGLSSPGLLLNALEKYAAGEDPEAAVRGSDCSVDTLRVCQSMLRGDWPAIRREIQYSTVEDAKGLRASALGYLRGILLHPKPSAKLVDVSRCIDVLADAWAPDDFVLHVKVIAALYKACGRF